MKGKVVCTKIKNAIKRIFSKNRGENMEKLNLNNVKDNFEDELDYSMIGEKVVLSLKDKFKEEFLIKKITNKFSMGYFDYITCICTPKKMSRFVLL